MKPSEKSKAMESLADTLAEQCFGRKRSESIRNDICVSCGEHVAGRLPTPLDVKEFSISGLCPSCFADCMGDEDEDEEFFAAKPED